MQKIMQKYVVWFLLVGSFFTTNLNAYDDWFDDFRSDLEDFLDVELDFRQVGAGVVVGALVVFARNYLQEPNKHKSDLAVGGHKQDKSVVLSFDKRVAWLQKSLKGVETINLNIKLIAALTAGFSIAKLEKFMNVLKRSAADYQIDFMDLKSATSIQERIYPIDMSHVHLAYDEIVCGSKTFSQREDSLIVRFHTAVHEAGHAVAIVKTDFYVLDHISMTPRTTSHARNILTYQDERQEFKINHLKDSIIIDFAGAVAEQILGFERYWYGDVSWYDEFKDEYEFYGNKYISEGLADLLTRAGAGQDVKAARKSAVEIIQRYQQMGSQSLDDKVDGCMDDEICKLFEECYQKSVELVTSCRFEVGQIAKLLMKQDMLLGDEVYALFGTSRPYYSFEV